jgi:hypothetical protein
MTTVSYLSALRVCCGVTVYVRADQDHATESARVGQQHAAGLAADCVVRRVPQHTKLSATRTIDRCWQTIPSSPHRKSARESFALGSAALPMSWRYTWAKFEQRPRTTWTSSVVGR